VRHFAIITALLALSACANPNANKEMSWVPRGTPTVPMEQARSECRFEISKDITNFDRLFLMSGQPAITPEGSLQGLSSQGTTRFQFCMQARGYDAGGWVDRQAPAG
jgi:hypothetical protein